MRRAAKVALGGVAALVLVAVGAIGWIALGPRSVPAGQPPLAKLDAAGLPAFREAFNGASGSIRLLVMLSPT